MPIPILQTWFGKKASAASPRPPKDRSGIRIGIPKVLNVWSTHQFWVGFLRDLGISSENIVFSSDSSEEQGREFGKGRGTVDCCYPVKAISGHYGELIFGQKRKIQIILSPMIYSLPVPVREHGRTGSGSQADLRLYEGRFRPRSSGNATRRGSRIQGVARVQSEDARRIQENPHLVRPGG